MKNPVPEKDFNLIRDLSQKATKRTLEGVVMEMELAHAATGMARNDLFTILLLDMIGHLIQSVDIFEIGFRGNDKGTIIVVKEQLRRLQRPDHVEEMLKLIEKEKAQNKG